MEISIRAAADVRREQAAVGGTAEVHRESELHAGSGRLPRCPHQMTEAGKTAQEFALREKLSPTPSVDDRGNADPPPDPVVGDAVVAASSTLGCWQDTPRSRAGRVWTRPERPSPAILLDRIKT